MMEEKASVKRERAFELDFLRGAALFLMILMHFSYDIRYIFRFNAFSYLDSTWFWVFIEPMFLCIFVGISGVCCNFSRNIVKRAVKLLGVALFVTFATYIATNYMNIDCLIIFNVLHVLACSMLLYALIRFIENKAKIDPKVMSVFLALFGLWSTQVGHQITRYDSQVTTRLLIPLGITGTNCMFMGDYMPFFPWVGVFLIGTVVGRHCYAGKSTLFPNAPSGFRKFSKPFEFLGRHSLIIYIVHQPIVLALTYAVVFIVTKVC